MERDIVKQIKRKILIVEDAPSVVRLYKKTLSGPFDLTFCDSAKQAAALIKRRAYFDLAIMDMVLPPEGNYDFMTEDYSETGLRLMERMILRRTCPRFYVITGLKNLRVKVERLAKEFGVLCQFDHKPAISSEMLKSRIDDLIASPFLAYTLGGLRMLAEETGDYLELCRGLSSSVPTFTEDEAAKLAAAMKWLDEALTNPWYHEFYNATVLTDKKMLEVWKLWINTLCDIQTLLQDDFEAHVQGVLHTEIEGAIVAIMSFIKDFQASEQSA